MGCRATTSGIELQLVQKRVLKGQEITLMVSDFGKSIDDAYTKIIHKEDYKQFYQFEKIRSWIISQKGVMKSDLMGPTKTVYPEIGKDKLHFISDDLDVRTVIWRPFDVELDDSGNTYCGILYGKEHVFFKLSTLTASEEEIFSAWIQRVNIAKIIWDVTMEHRIFPRMKGAIDLQLIYSVGSHKKALGVDKKLAMREKNYEDLLLIQQKYINLLSPLVI
jgi:hypothetical protein